MGDLTKLEAGMRIPYGGNKYVEVDQELALSFEEGDRLIVVQETGDLLHVPSQDWESSDSAVAAAVEAFDGLRSASADQVTRFFELAAERLGDDDVFELIARANAADVARSRSDGRSVTRLILDANMRAGMIEGLLGWQRTPPPGNDALDVVDHDGWSVELRHAALGVVGFVFEGRPNVLADGAGVLRGGNTVALRIGSAAYETAVAIMDQVITPALVEAGLPAGAVSLVRSRSRAAGWAMFSDRRLSLAVARGSGEAVSQLGAVARQAGIPVSLHGTGGAWMIVDVSADEDTARSAIVHSLDRKVCNTLNTLCIVDSVSDRMMPVALGALSEAARARGVEPKLHYTDRAAAHVPESWHAEVPIARAHGKVTEPRAEPIEQGEIGVEWEWEDSPEITVTIVDSIAEAVELFNSLSPRFAASLISSDPDSHVQFYETVDAPFVGNGMTRWVDGQYALDKPELGLSNWQGGRLMMRGGILSADSVYTIRARAWQNDPGLHR